MMSQEQFKLRVDSEFLAQLLEMAKRYNRRSAQEVAMEVLEQYLTLWAEGAEKQKQALADHMASFGTGRLPRPSALKAAESDVKKAREIAKGRRRQHNGT